MLTLAAGQRLSEALVCNRINRTFIRLVLQADLPQDGFQNFLSRLQRESLMLDQPPACIYYLIGIAKMNEAGAQSNDVAAPRPFWLKALQASQLYLAALRTLAPLDADLANTAIEAYPENPQAWIWAGSIAQAQGRQAEAMIAYHQAASLQPSNHLVWENLGGLAEGQANLPLARQAYQAACDLYPVRNGSCLSAGRLAFNAQDWQAVTYYYPRGFFPESADGWARLILAGRILGLDETGRWLEQAQQEYPADYDALIEGLK